ncbi:MAG: LysE family transporter [Elusimicrobia bacterium]|nr:LysE family transporter [Elusimicrobiota bacterium]
MNYLSIFLISFTIALTGALAPGPLLTMVIAKSLKYGKKTGPLVIAGHAILEVLMVIVLVMGLGKIINNPVVIRVITVVGALILLYFGCSILRSLPHVSLSVPVESFGSSTTLILQGITMSIANPYWSIWWVTVGLGLLLSARGLGIRGLACFLTGHILADLAWYSFISYSIGKSKKFISVNTYKKILGVCAVVIICFGFYFGITGFIKKL